VLPLNSAIGGVDRHEPAIDAADVNHASRERAGRVINGKPNRLLPQDFSVACVKAEYVAGKRTLIDFSFAIQGTAIAQLVRLGSFPGQLAGANIDGVQPSIVGGDEDLAIADARSADRGGEIETEAAALGFAELFLPR